MIELEFRLIFLGVAWVVCSTGVVSSNDIPAPESNRLLDDCKRECHDISPTDVPGKESEVSLFFYLKFILFYIRCFACQERSERVY